MASSSRHRPLTDKELEQLLLESSAEESNNDFFGGEDSDNDPDYVEVNSDAESEQSGEDEIEIEATSVKAKRLSIVKGKNGYKWSTDVPEKRGRHQARNLVTHLPGAKGAAKNITSPLEAWNLLVSNDILDFIVHHTNEEISRRCSDLPHKQTYHKETDIVEVKALIGLLFLCGVQKAAHLSLKELWSNKFGTSLYRATMSLNRFDFLTSCLRFDDKATRPQRKESDKFAPIRQIWEMFISNCRAFYTPHEYCTIDEQLMGYRGNCPFRIYMASKPDKYGIKFVMLHDARTWYMVNAIPYTGKVETENNEPVPSYYVRKLTETIQGTGRNVTVDNWFSSVPLFDDMLNQYNLTMLGTVREIPPSFLVAKEAGVSKFAFDQNKTLVSYAPKKNKVVLLMSTSHYSDAINPETRKPQMVMDYNDTKEGTDTFDKLCHTYTTARSTRRWPMRVFCGILDHSGINAMVLFSKSNQQEKLKRRQFLNNLAYDLIEPQLKRRLESTTLRRGIREIIRDILGIEDFQPPVEVLDKYVRCSFCVRNKDRKTKKICMNCKRAMWDEHRAMSCVQCAN